MQKNDKILKMEVIILLNNMAKELKDTELFMLAQFIDVMEIINEYDKIEDVKNDIKTRKKLYVDSIEKIRDSKDFLSLNLYNDSIDRKLDKSRKIYSKDSKSNDIYLAYKIGLIEGMKVKNKCT